MSKPDAHTRAEHLAQVVNLFLSAVVYDVVGGHKRG